MPNPTTINEDQPMNISETITKLRKLLAKATKGPWSGKGGFIVPSDSLSRFDAVCSVINCDGDTIANRELITAAINAFPSLLDALEAREPEKPKKTDEELVEEMCEAGRAAYEDALGDGESCYPAYQISMRAALAAVRGEMK